MIMAMKKAYLIFLNAIPILAMIGLIPLVQNDYWLGFFDLVIIAIAFSIKRERNETVVLLSGFFIMIVFESLFIATGVEFFVRHSLFGIMPLWLPILWAYGFVAIKRGLEILTR
jgi:hypothetical protein